LKTCDWVRPSRVVNMLKIPKSIDASFPAGARGGSAWCSSAGTRRMTASEDAS
jgi:hypothetical protein